MVNVDPSHIKTVKLRVTKKPNRLHGLISFPKDILRRHDLNDGDEVVIAYLCKAGEDLPENNQK